MESTRSEEVIKLAGQYFTKATDADLNLIWDGVKGYDFADAERAIKEHRLECGKQAYRPDIRRIINLAAAYFRNRTISGRPQQRIIDFIRKFYPFAANDADIIREHFTSSWAAVKQANADLRGETIARAYILAHCRCALTEIGWSQTEADDAAHLYVGLEPGEKIPKQGIFNDIPKPLEESKSWDAIVALAKDAKAKQSDALV